MPLVSVLLPVYNAERYLGPAIESILTQTFTDFELLITDDGSSDRSLEILQSYAAQDTRIRLLSRENKGLIYTLNEMLEQANGEFWPAWMRMTLPHPTGWRFRCSFSASIRR